MAVRIVATMRGAWGRPVEVIEPVGSKLRFLAHLMKAVGRSDAVVLRGTSGFEERYAEIVAAALIKLRWRSPPAVLISDAEWDLSSGSLERRLRFIPGSARALRLAMRLAIRAIDGPHVCYGVLSTEERDSFASIWGVSPERVHFTPFYATLWRPPDEDVPEAGYLLAAGNTHRNFELLVEAVRGLPVRVRIASRWQPAKPLPDNVAVEWLDDHQYRRAMLEASALITPLESATRSVGQQTYLSGMLFGKPTIVTKAPGVCDYVTNGEDGLVVGNTASDLRKAIQWVTNPSNKEALTAMAKRAEQTVAERFLPRHYWGRLADIVTEHARQMPGRNGSEEARGGTTT